MDEPIDHEGAGDTAFADGVRPGRLHGSLALRRRYESLRLELVHCTRRLDESEARFHALVEGNADGIIVVDHAGQVRFANGAAAALFGIRAEDLIGTPFGHPVVAGQTTEIDALPRGGTPVVMEMRVVEAQWEGVPARIACLRDITDRKRAEDAARQRAADRALTDLIAVISHDLRTPLNSILGYADLLELGVPEALGARSREWVRRIRGSAEHQVYLIDQLLAFSRIEAGALELRPRPVDLAGLLADVRDMIAPLTERAALTLHVEAPAGLVVEADPDALRQIAINLATNAVKYTERGEIRLTAERSATDVIVRVTDTGIGIAPEHLARVFDSFWQAQPERSGAGLGLSIVRRLARALGGDVEVESSPGRGSRFTFTLPT